MQNGDGALKTFEREKQRLNAVSFCWGIPEHVRGFVLSFYLEKFIYYVTEFLFLIKLYHVFLLNFLSCDFHGSVHGGRRIFAKETLKSGTWPI